MNHIDAIVFDIVSFIGFEQAFLLAGFVLFNPGKMAFLYSEIISQSSGGAIDHIAPPLETPNVAKSRCASIGLYGAERQIHI